MCDDRVIEDLNAYQDSVREETEVEKAAALLEARISVIEGDGLHEMLAELPENISRSNYKCLQDLLLDNDHEEFMEILFNLIMAEWNRRATEAAGF